MNNFVELTYDEMLSIDAGGVLSCIAGTLAGATIGFYAGAVAYMISGDPNNLAQGTIAGAAAGFWVGLGCPIP